MNPKKELLWSLWVRFKMRSGIFLLPAGLGFRVQGLRLAGLRFRVQGLRLSGLGFRVQGLRLSGLGFRA